MKPTSHELVERFGRQYKQLIDDAIEWLDEREPQWDLGNAIDRVDFIESLIANLIASGSVDPQELGDDH